MRDIPPPSPAPARGTEPSDLDPRATSWHDFANVLTCPCGDCHQQRLRITASYQAVPRVRDPATVYDLAAARQQAMPREVREHVADMLLEGSALDGADLQAGIALLGRDHAGPSRHRHNGERPVFLGDFSGGLPPLPRDPTSHLARVLLLAFAGLVGVVIWWLLPGGA